MIDAGTEALDEFEKLDGVAFSVAGLMALLNVAVYSGGSGHP